MRPMWFESALSLCWTIDHDSDSLQEMPGEATIEQILAMRDIYPIPGIQR